MNKLMYFGEENHAFVVNNSKHVILLATVILVMYDSGLCPAINRARGRQNKRTKTEGQKNLKEEQKIRSVYLT